MWISFPHFLWISHNSSFFQKWNVDNFLAVVEKVESFAQISEVIHNSGGFIHFLFSGAGKKSPGTEDFPSVRYPQDVEMWISFPHFLWISDVFLFVSI
jgi:hypothetical protein